MTAWRPVPGWPTYEVSDAGEVRSLTTRRVLAFSFGGRSGQYRRVMLGHQVRGRRYRRHAYVHVLVLEAFAGPRPAGMVVCHRNDDPEDNRLANLYYGTHENNECDKYLNSLPLREMEDAPF